jgi:transposase
MDYAIGIDVGKREMVACVRRSDGVSGPAISFPNTTLGTKQFIRKLKTDAVPHETPVLLEGTGPYHWATARLMREDGWNVRIVNPLATRQMIRASVRKRKTDKVDAGHLAFLASQGTGYPFVETVTMAHDKALVRHYWRLRKLWARTTIRERYLKEFHGITSTLGVRIERESKRCNQVAIRALSKGNDLRYLDSIPGVSPMIAATLLAELRPLNRFKTVAQIVAYAGLDPKVIQSGGKPAHYGKLSKRGSPILRHALFFAAFGAFSRDPFAHHYRRYRERGLAHTEALCIIARKILRIAFALLKKRTEFNTSYLDGT